MKKIDLTQEEIIIFKEFLKEYKDKKAPKSCSHCGGTGQSVHGPDYTTASAHACYSCGGKGKK
jgi:DnaJ-class molecular chaperone